MLAPIASSVQDDLGISIALSPKNTITDNGSITRNWNILARACSPAGSASFEFLAGSPMMFKTVDNNAPYAFFANVGTSYFSQATPNYGPGVVNFTNGTYRMLVEFRANAAANVGPYPKDRNKLTGGSLLATRTIEFMVQGTGGARIGVDEEIASTDENWATIFQNPVSKEIIVRLAGKVGEDVQLNLVNLQGQALHQSAVTMEAPSQFTKINVSDFSSGLYILKAVKGDKVKTIKVLKAE